MFIQVDHPISERNYSVPLKTKTSAGDTTATLVNVTNVSTNKFLIFGNPGDAQTELKAPSAINTTTMVVTVPALLFDHASNINVIICDYDKVEFSRSSDYNPDTGSGTWSILSTVDIDIDNNFTEYEDGSTLTTYYYKFRYKNSITNAFSDYSDPISSLNTSERTVSYMIQNIRRDTHEKDTRLIDDATIMKLLSEAQSRVYASKVNWKCLHKRVIIPLIAGQASYTLPTTYSHYHKAKYTYMNPLGQVEREYFLTPEDDYELTQRDDVDYGYSDDYIDAFRVDDIAKTVRFDPVPYLQVSGSSAFVEFTYFKRPAQLTSFESTTDIDMPTLLEAYAKYRINILQKDWDSYKANKQEFEEELIVWKGAQFMELAKTNFRPEGFKRAGRSLYNGRRRNYR